VWTVHVYRQAKFGNDISNGGRVIAILASCHLGFCCSPKVTSGDVAGCPVPPAYQIWWRYLKKRLSYGHFPFSKWRPSAILDFVTGQKWRQGTVRTVHVYHHAKFGNNISNGGRVIAIFRFSKWRPAAIFHLVVAQKWHPGTLRAVHGHYCNKFCEDISKSFWVMDNFLFFKKAAVRHLGFRYRSKIRHARCALSMSTIVPNLVTIAQTAAELLRFSVVQNGGRPPSWIL